MRAVVAIAAMLVVVGTAAAENAGASVREAAPVSAGSVLMEAGGGISARLLVGPFPDVPAFTYPVGIEGDVRLAWYLVNEIGPSGGVLRGPGWTVNPSASWLNASPIEPVFGPSRTMLFAVETGPSYLVGRALGSGLAVDLTGGAGYYLSSYEFAAERVLAYRPVASAHLALHLVHPSIGIRLRGGVTIFIEEPSRSFVSVASGIFFAWKEPS